MFPKSMFNDRKKLKSIEILKKEIEKDKKNLEVLSSLPTSENSVLTIEMTEYRILELEKELKYIEKETGSGI